MLALSFYLYFHIEVNLFPTNERLKVVYGRNEKFLAEQEIRFRNLTDKFEQEFENSPENYFSSPGRTEICGNHTDHNNGKVVAAGIQLDSIAAVRKREDNLIIVYSIGFDERWEIDLSNLHKEPEDNNSSKGLIKGVASYLKKAQFKLGGFNACITSNVMVGSGLSSSASFEVLIGQIFSYLFNNDGINLVDIAKAGQYAENYYFGKPCGLMDQIACAYGGLMKIDFVDPEHPQVEKIDFKFKDYSIAVVDTGGSHADLTEDYASIPLEMKAVSKFMKADVLREVPESTFFDLIPTLRNEVGDRPVLRALHYFDENNRVDYLFKAIIENQIEEILKLIKFSGESSARLLQNSFSTKFPLEQNITLAQAATNNFTKDFKNGVCRIHGGGFAGTILTLIKENLFDQYKNTMETIFGSNSVTKLAIRNKGVTVI